MSLKPEDDPPPTVYLDLEAGTASLTPGPNVPVDPSQIAELLGTPRFTALRDRQLRLAGLGVPALVFVDEALAGNALSRFLGAQPPPLERYIVVSLDGFNDEVLDRAMAFATHWETHLADEGPSVATLYQDNTFDGESKERGRTNGKITIRRMNESGVQVVSPELLQRVGAARRQHVDGIGMARVVTLK